MNKTKGFSLVGILVIVGAVVVLGIVAWRVWDAGQNKQSDSANSNQQTNGQSPTGNDDQQPEPTVEESTTLLDDRLSLVLPDNWSKKSEGQLTRTVDGTEYVINFQLTDSDYLTGNTYTGNMSVYEEVETAKGTHLFVIKTADSYMTVSTCAPANDKACSLSIDGKPLFILLHTYQKGDQYVREFDFSNPTTESVMKEFVTIAKSLNL